MDKHPLNFELQRDLAFFDLETTGTDTERDRIVEIAVLRVSPGGEERSWSQRVNPGIPIPPESTAIHGITDADVAAEPAFAEIAPQVLEWLRDCDLGGYNLLRFDIPLLTAEFARAGHELDMGGRKVVDAQVIFHRCEPRHLRAALRFYCGAELDDAHTAGADVRASFEVFNAQVAHYPDLPRDLESLAEFCRSGRETVDIAGRILWRGAKAVLGFGKYRGQSLQRIAREQRNYLVWCVDKADFHPDTKRILAAALKGEFPSR